MENLQRKNQKIFCLNKQDDLNVFGSRKEGQAIQSSDVETLQSINYNNGWSGAVIANTAPTMEDFNTLNYINTYQLSYLFQKGIAEWNNKTTYYKGSIAMLISNDKPILYFSKIDNNININPIVDNTSWEELSFGGGASMPLLTTLWSDHLINNASYLRSDTFSWQNGNMYTSCYNELLKEKATATEQVENYKINSIVLPTFTNNTQDGITISDSRDNTTVLQAIFNGTNEKNAIGSWSTYWINIDYGKNVLIKSYIIQADNSQNPEYPSAWTLQGSIDGENWEILDTQENIIFSLNEIKTFNVTTNKLYIQYRIVFSAGIETTENNGQLKKVSFNADNAVNIQYYKSANGYNIVTAEQEQNIIDLYNNTGVAWYYILDETNKRFKLPRTKYNFVGYRDNAGGYVAESLPNIKGNITYQGLGFAGLQEGALSNTLGTGYNHQSTTNNQGNTINFDASKSSATYQDDAPVQQRATQMYLYFYVGNVIREEHEIDVGTITEQLNNKANIDLNNISEIGQQKLNNLVIGYARYPDYNSGIDQISLAGTNIEAVQDGWLYIWAGHTSGTNNPNVVVNNVATFKFANNAAANANSYIFLPIKKGDIYKTNGVIYEMIFYPNKQ